MKFLVFSDSHGMCSNLTHIAGLHPDADAIIFLGDGLRDLREIHSLPVIAVRGNCDPFTSPEPTLRSFTANGVRVCLIHGHEQKVKDTDAVLYSLGKSYDLILHGHTHVHRNDTINVDGRTVGICNPGYAGLGRYGILVTEDGKYTFTGARI